MRSRFGKLIIGFVVLVIGSIVVIEVSNSDFIMNSKTYELVGYSEVDRSAEGDQVVVIKSKRFGFLPGADTVVFVQDGAGRTVDRRPMTSVIDVPVPSDGSDLGEELVPAGVEPTVADATERHL